MNKNNNPITDSTTFDMSQVFFEQGWKQFLINEYVGLKNEHTRAKNVICQTFIERLKNIGGEPGSVVATANIKLLYVSFKREMTESVYIYEGLVKKLMNRAGVMTEAMLPPKTIDKILTSSVKSHIKMLDVLDHNEWYGVMMAGVK